MLMNANNAQEELWRQTLTLNKIETEHNQSKSCSNDKICKTPSRSE